MSLALPDVWEGRDHLELKEEEEAASMKTMTIVQGDHVFRWAGGSFIPVWTVQRADEHVPDDMIEVPDSLNKSKATRDDIARIVNGYSGK